MPALTVLAEQLLAPVPGGTGRYTHEIIRALSSSRPAGWSVRTATAWHRNLGPADGEGLPVPRRLPASRRALAVLWAHGLPPTPAGDVIHAPTPLAPLGSWPRRGAVVVTVHDAVPYSHPETLTPRGVSWHRTMIERAGRSAAAIVVPTRATAAELARWAGITDRVEVIGEGVSPAFAQPAAASAVQAVRRRFGLPARYLTAVGTLEPRKGLDVLIEALAQVDPDVGLAVAGPPGWGESAVADLVRRFGLADRVRLVGRLADAELAALVSGAAASVTPSRAEGFGLPLLEAMSIGVPVVHSDLPVLIEVSGGAGLAAPVGDADALAAGIRRVLDDSELAAGMVRAGRAAAATRTWALVAQQLWGLYGRL